MKATRTEVYAAIDSERDYQNAMAEKAHGDPSNDFTKALENFSLYMTHYINETNSLLSTSWGPEAYKKPLDNMRKIAALAVAAMEVHGAPFRVTATKHSIGTDLISK